MAIKLKQNLGLSSGAALTAVIICGCTSNVAPVAFATQTGATTGDDLRAASDDFHNPQSLSAWKSVAMVEGWNNNQLERAAIDRGWLTLMPYASTWYRDYRGVLLFKTIKGDFVATTRVHVRRRSGEGAPQSQFNLAGLMVRSPRSISPQTWRPGGENYIFLSLGAGDRPGTFQLEVKQTVNSDSQLQLTPARGADALIRVVRQGSSVAALVDEGSGWRVVRRYRLTPPWTDEAQVGLTVYADWQTASQLDPPTHNRSVIRAGNPDLIANFDYVRFRRPAPTAPRLDSASDAEIVRAFGAS